jgi:hypothetical protein
MLTEQGVSAPTPNPNPTIMIRNEPKLQPARSAILSDRSADCGPRFPHPPAGRQWRTLASCAAKTRTRRKAGLEKRGRVNQLVHRNARRMGCARVLMDEVSIRVVELLIIGPVETIAVVADGNYFRQHEAYAPIRATTGDPSYV